MKIFVYSAKSHLIPSQCQKRFAGTAVKTYVPNVAQVKSKALQVKRESVIDVSR